MPTKYPSSAAQQIADRITKALDSIGIMFRVFQRIKTGMSLTTKINSKSKYLNGEAKVQDIVGIRIVLYFPDDVEIVHSLISSLYKESEKDTSIDDLDANTFKPVRYNIIYSLDIGDSYSIDNEHSRLVDSTFELQIRTMLSEGWHEIEHDLRYKFNSDWSSSPAESRTLNGVYAALETNEWTIIQILDSVAYRHYKERNWEAMFRQKLRLRLHNFSLSNEVRTILNTDTELAKNFFRIERKKLIYQLCKREYSYPLNLKNLIYFANVTFIQDKRILALTPIEFIDEFSVETS